MWRKFRRTAKASSNSSNGRGIASSQYSPLERRLSESNLEEHRRNTRGRRSRRQTRPRETSWQQWRSLRVEQLVADEIESILNDRDEREMTSQEDRRRNSLPRRLSLSSLRRGSTSSRSGSMSSSMTVSPTPSAAPTRRRRNRVRDSRINGYTLFGDNAFPKSSQQTVDAAVIYEKDYPIVFTPLITFLGVTFLGLVVLRIVVALLTVAMGVIWVLIAVASAIDFMRKPRQKARRLLILTHNAPMLVFGVLGALCVSCTALWVHGRTDEISVAWSLLEGTIYGVEVGAIWLVLFGDGSEQSSTALWIVRFWKKSCDRVEQLQLWWYDSTCSNETAEDGRKCMICLEAFHGRDKRRLLPCLHGFHQDCVEQWLCMKPTCPICRIPTTRRSRSLTSTE